MRVGLGSDQIGFECKERLKARLAAREHAVLDVCADDRGQAHYHIATDQLASVIDTRRRAFGIPPRRLARVVQHICNNLDKPLAVRELSKIAEMSQSHFSKLFKLSTGLAPNRFVLQQRIKRSKELLCQDCRHRV